MKKNCLGCGIQLQTTDKEAAGFVHSLENDYCTSCFRLKHYGDLSKVTQQKVDPFEMLNKISQLDALFVWVVDVFHLEESKINSLHRWFNHSPVVILLTKRELLPHTMSNAKIEQMILPLIKESHLKVVDILLTGNYGKLNREDNIIQINKLKNQFNKEKVVFFGNTNVGKSSVINALSNSSTLSVSALPGTTIDLVEIDSDIENMIDTPGIAIRESLLDLLSPLTVKKILPKKPIKPINFQLKGAQSIIIDGFGYLDFSMEGSYSITCYLNDLVKIHRTKQENSLKQFERLSLELKDLESEKLITKDIAMVDKNTDLVILDIGYISIHNVNVKLRAHFKESVQTIVRKAIL